MQSVKGMPYVLYSGGLVPNRKPLTQNAGSDSSRSQSRFAPSFGGIGSRSSGPWSSRTELFLFLSPHGDRCGICNLRCVSLGLRRYA